ncbi:squalene/phytoene synthase family protein [Mycobacterium tuberculosis]
MESPSRSRTAARNFYYGIRLCRAKASGTICGLCARPPDRRRRRRRAGPETKITELDAIRKSLDNIDDSSDPVLVALADAARRFPVPIAMFAELIDGARMEIDWTGCRDFDELIVYCRRGPARSESFVFPSLDPSARRRRDTPSSWESLCSKPIFCATFERTF